MRLWLYRFVGTTEFAPGKWVGVELEDGIGKNNGVVNGKEYFKCTDNRGLFVRSSQLQVTCRLTLSGVHISNCIHVQ